MHDVLAGFVGALVEHEEWLLTGVGVAVAAWLASMARRLKGFAARARAVASRSFEGPSVPKATFIESWHLLEKIVSEAADRTGCSVSAPGRGASELHRHGIITEEHLRLHDRLRLSADRMMHGDGSAVTGDETREMVVAALDLTREIYSLSLSARPPSATPPSGAAASRIEAD